VILRLRAQGLCAHELFVLADHDFGMDLVIDGRIGSWPAGDRHCAAAVPETPAKPVARGPRERRSEVVRAGQHQSGVEAIRRRLCCYAQAVSGAGHQPPPSFVARGDRCSSETGRRGNRPASLLWAKSGLMMRTVTEVRRQIDDEANFRQSDCATVQIKVVFTLGGRLHKQALQHATQNALYRLIG
jgi:hypothetical protein